MSTKFLSPGWRMPRNANQSKSSNYSLDFDGTSDKITCANSPAITGDFSISLWINQTTTPGTFGYLIEQDGAKLRIGVNTNNTIYFQLSSNSMNSTTAITNGSWAHLVLVKNGSSMNIYIDSVAQTPATAPASHTISSGDLAIGHQVSSSGNGFSGKITEACIFDYALSASQATTLWGGGTSVSNPMALPSPPIAYYPLGESAGGFVGSSGTWLTENNAIGDYVFDFNANYVDLGDSNDFSFTNGSGQDLPFTLSAWVNMNDASSFRIITKYGTNTEWYLYTTGSDILRFRTNDSSTGGYIGRGYSTAITSYENKWIHVVGTYDGSESNSGFKLYINATRVDDTDAGSGTYNGMVNSTDTVKIGKMTASDVTNGKFSNVQIFNASLSGPEVETLYNYGSPIRTLANIPQNSNLKAWYKLDASEIYNISSTEWSVDNNQNPSAYPSSLDFNGNNDYVDISGTIYQVGTGDVTISAWANTSTTASGNVDIFGLGDNTTSEIRLQRQADKFGAYVNSSTASGQQLVGATTISTGQWYSVILVKSSNVFTLYLNGISDNNITWTGGALNATDGSIGAYFGGGSNRFNGSISNVQVFNTALSASDITSIYNSGTPLADMSSFSSLVSWWKLNNTTTGIQDSKGSNNGTNNGATEYAGFVNTLAGDSTGMSQSNLVQSDLQTVAPYSKYAMNFSGTGDYIDITDITLSGNKSVSFWVNFTSTIYGVVFGGASYNYYPFIDSTNISIRAGGTTSSFAHGGITAGVWYHICITGDGTNATAYLNGSSLGTQTDRGFSFTLINGEHTGLYGVDGKLSNCAIWNTVLTSSEVREIYNEGLPSNLHNFSGATPTAWWQLGENSSYASGWTFADEIGSNDGTGYGLAETDLTNGVGTTANGVSTGMAVGALVGDAPYSTANAISSGMAVQAFDSENPPNVISGRSEDVPS